ncbi:Multidrug export protein AcrE [Alphaproteobacteria bacterium SO-S41]|nr:Multidrug export protein AcrE [Alphaproteobacteria bacterium SO-S41]
MSRRGIILVSIVAVICVGLVGFNLFMQGFIASMMANQHRPPVPVSAIKVEAITWAPGIDAVGTAKAGSGADLAIEAAGVVKSIAVASNQKVTANQLLVQIDDSVEQANMLSAQAAIKLAQADVDRITPLVRRGASAQATLDQAVAQLETARANYAGFLAVTEQKAIQAPFGGIVGVPRVVVGQYVAVGTIVLTLQDIDRILVDFTVPEQEAGLLAKGQKARFGITTDNLAFSGTVTGFDPKVDPQTRLISAQALLDAPAGRILPGQFLRVRVSLPEEANVIAVPETAVVPSLYGDYVLLVVTDPPAEGAAADAAPREVVRQTFVTTGRRDGQRIEVTKGLKAGDTIVVAGQNRLQNGAAVTVTDNEVPSGAADEAKP